MRTIAIANQKGGCGKTTVAINLSASFAREGRRVLLIDLDPQAHCALGMAVPEEQIDLSILDCLLRHGEAEPLELSRITWQIAPNLDLAPSRSNLATLEQTLVNRDDGEELLREVLGVNGDRYDYCVVDCPPHLGVLMKNALRAADVVVIPVDTGYFSLHGLTQQLATLERLGERSGVKPSVRVLPNQYDVRTKLAREILGELRKRYSGVVFETVVNFNTKLKEGASFGQPITEFAPKSMGARDFQSLAREIIASEPPKTVNKDILEHVERLAADAERLLATTTTLVGNRRQMPGEASTPVLDASEPAATKAEEAVASVPRESVPTGGGVVIKTAQSPQAPALPALGALPKQVSIPAPAQSPVSTQPSAGAATRAGVPGIVIPAPAAKTQASPPVQPTSTPPATAKPTTGRTPTVERAAPRPVTPAEPPVREISHEEIARKIEAIYGVSQEGDTSIFLGRYPEAGEVQLAGDFNDWMPHTTPMRRLGTGDFEARLRLPKGRYRYRLVIDGRWSHDHNNPLIETNEYGELNSIVEVKQ